MWRGGRLAAGRCLIGFGSAGTTLFAAFIGTTGGIIKMRGWRRVCSSVESAPFSVGAGTSRVGGRVLNRFSAS